MAKSGMNLSFAASYAEKATELCKELVLKDLASVSVSFESRKFVRTIKDNRVTFSDRLAALGGTLGLFTGMSLLSLIEAGFWIVKYLLHLLPIKRGGN